MRYFPARILTILWLLGAFALSLRAQPLELASPQIRAHFDGRGLTLLEDLVQGRSFAFERDRFAVEIDGNRIESHRLPDPEVGGEAGKITYRYRSAPFSLEVVYELRPEWRFLSKQIWIHSPHQTPFRVDAVEVFQGQLAEAPSDHFIPRGRFPRLGLGDYGIFLRYPHAGLLAVVQNPFLQAGREGAAFSVAYRPEMEWDPQWGPFPADRGLLAPHRQTGIQVQAEMVPEWKWTGGRLPEGIALQDWGEVEAFTECVRAFILPHQEKTRKVHVGWTENDYQIDVSVASGREEYKRIIDRAAEVGVTDLVYAPAHSELSHRHESIDDWSWEYVLWLGLGQKIRRNEWDPKRDPLPESVREMIDYARSRGVRLLAYVYPVLPFAHNPEWIVRGSERHRNRINASLGFRSLQDWLIENLIAFRRRTGIGGYAFDYTFLWYPGKSVYSQWWGWLRVQKALRNEFPDIVIDGRQLLQRYGPWSWVAGSYPHPTAQDEQPESFVNFPDLHFDRVSAHRQRFTAYEFRVLDYCPPELLPGYMTHQVPRNDFRGDLVLEAFRTRNWDYLGWKFSVIASIATAGLNNVVNMLPARDPYEWRLFSQEDKAFLRDWLAWTDENREYLKNTRPIIGQPMIGRVDGTSALADGQGYLFLFNPNARRLEAEFRLDESIGLARSAASYLVEEIYPIRGLLHGKPDRGLWEYADTVSIPLDGASARVLRLQPAPERREKALLFNAPGQVQLVGGHLRLEGVRREMGSQVRLLVLLPDAGAVRRVSVNGQDRPFQVSGDRVSIPVRFAGASFHKLQPVGRYDPAFTGGTFQARFTVPARVFQQLEKRKESWNMPWSFRDLETTWLAPHRLLLFVQIAEPSEEMEVRMKLDAQEVELTRAYASIRPHVGSFVGFYADLSQRLEPDREYQLELVLPRLQPGQFQGAFFENVEPEFTELLD